MNISEDSTVLSSWKDIAKYLGKGVRTVQRWERDSGLPVRRPPPPSHREVLAFTEELDTWTRHPRRFAKTNGAAGESPSAKREWR